MVALHSTICRGGLKGGLQESWSCLGLKILRREFWRLLPHSSYQCLFRSAQTLRPDWLHFGGAGLGWNPSRVSQLLRIQCLGGAADRSSRQLRHHNGRGRLKQNDSFSGSKCVQYSRQPAARFGRSGRSSHRRALWRIVAQTVKYAVSGHRLRFKSICFPKMARQQPLRWICQVPRLSSRRAQWLISSGHRLRHALQGLGIMRDETLPTNNARR